MPRAVPLLEIRRSLQRPETRPQRLPPTRGARLFLQRSTPPDSLDRARFTDSYSPTLQRLERTRKNSDAAREKRRAVEERWKEIDAES